MTKEKFTKILNRICIVAGMITIPAAIYLACNGAGLTDGTFGPGSYYYSDIPNWDKIFLGERAIRLGFDNPVIGYGFFIIWGIFIFNMFLWVDRKFK